MHAAISWTVFVLFIEYGNAKPSEAARFTGCITWFSKLENDVENANKTTNLIGIFTAWNIVMVI